MPSRDPIALLAEPTRRRIVQLVWRHERSAGDIAAHFRTTFGAVSQHLARLHASGVLHLRRDGRRRLYRADHDALGPLAAALEAMWADRLATLKSLAEGEQRRLDRITKRKTRHDAPPQPSDPRPESAPRVGGRRGPRRRPR